MSGKVLEEVIKEFDETYPESVSELSIPDETADNNQHETVFMTEVEDNKENVNLEENVDTKDIMTSTDDIQNKENLDKVEDSDQDQFNCDGEVLGGKQISNGYAKQFLYYKCKTETNQTWENCFENIHVSQDGSATPCVAEMVTTSDELYTDTIKDKNDNVKLSEIISTADNLFNKSESDEKVKSSERRGEDEFVSTTDQLITDTNQTEAIVRTTNESDNFEYLKEDNDDTIKGNSNYQKVEFKEESKNESNTLKSAFISHTLPDMVNDADLDDIKDVNNRDHRAIGITQNQDSTPTLTVVAELTKDNVTQHAKRFKEESLIKLATILSENSDESSSPKRDNFMNMIHSDQYTGNDLEKPKDANIVTTSNASSHTKHTESAEVIQQTTVTLSDTNRPADHQQVLSKSPTTKKKKHAKSKRKGKKSKKTLLDHIETLIGNNESSEYNASERKTEQPKPTLQRFKLANEDSGIENDFEINNKGENSNDVNSNQSVNTHPLPVDLHGDKQVLAEVKPLPKRKPKHYTKRPVYDASNTSTKLILLNNKYGKHSRLWRSNNFNPHADRGNLIDPTRHSREPTFYGHFHSRCSTSESPVRFSTTIKPLIQITDRPHSDLIGDRLYETRISKNPNRHRMCAHRQATDLQPLDFSPPNRRSSSPMYAFAWEKIYSEPPIRPTTSNNRPPSTISGKKIGNEIIKIPDWNSSDVRDKIKQRLTVNKG